MSIAMSGKLERGVDSDRLKEALKEIQTKPSEENDKKFFKWGKNR